MVENIEKLIGERVRIARERAKLTQSELATNAKTSLTTINRLEKGKQRPHSDTLREIAKALQVSYEELFFGVNEPKVSTDNASKAELIGRITVGLATLQENELRTTLDLIEEFHRLRASVQKNEVG